MSLFDYFEKVSDAPLRSKLRDLYCVYKKLIETVPASVKQHHNWTGGYAEHVAQVIDFALKFYDLVKDKVKFTQDDVILVAFIHDFDKLFRYFKLDKPKDGREWDRVGDYPAYEDSAKVTQMCAKSGIILTDEHLNALALHHGGWSKYDGRMSRLATILHAADLFSTFITCSKGEGVVL